ncbi:MAG: dTDP-4-dehydrorhamnose reductase [Desulfuromonas sp.]|nr:MAG: dTDP-4-dehydrorhamnose reductase [Desulfuromonas sp.]
MDLIGKRVALVGSKGMLAFAFKEALPDSIELLELDLPEFDLTDRRQVVDTLVGFGADVVINCAAYTNVDGCESEEELAVRVNGEGVANLAEATRQCGGVLAHVSTDYVFAGDKQEPYVEADMTGPVSAYGRSKLLGEESLRSSGLDAYFIVRTSWLYGPGGKNFVETVRRLATEKQEMRIVADQIGTPTYTVDLAQAIFNLLQTEAYGLYHFSNDGQCSWFDFSSEIVNQLRALGGKLAVEKVLPIRTEDYPLPATRPAYSVFSKEKYISVTGADVPGWRESLTCYLKRQGQ